MKSEKLERYCDVISGYAFKSTDWRDSGVPVVKIGNISNGTDIIFDEQIQYVEEEFKNKIDSKYLICKGDILLSLTGSHINQPNSMVGRCCRNRQNKLYFLNQRAGKVIPFSSVDKSYLYYLLSTKEIKYAIANKAYGGANQVNISPRDIKNIRWTFPRLEIQQRIASILSAYDDLIENNNRRIKILEQMAENLYKEWFVRFRFPGYEQAEFENGIPKGWEVKKIKDCIKRLPYNRLYKGSELKSEGKVIVIDQSTAECLGYHDNEASHYANYDSPIILFGDHSCKFKLMCTNFSLGENVIPFTVLHREKDNTYFLYYAVHKLITTEEYKRHWNRLVNMKILKPSQCLQNKFAEFIISMQEQKQNLFIQNQNLTKQRDKLLPRLMSGKLEV